MLPHLGAEDTTPPAGLWDEELISSRLLIYETLGRLHAGGRGASHGDQARDVFRRVSFIDLIEPVVGRSADPFPFPVRTLDALHLATMAFLVEQGVPTCLASYDRRLSAAAIAMGVASYGL